MNKQSVSGFKLQNCVVKKGKESEKVRIVLEADVADVSAGDKDVGAVLQAFMNHLSSETEIGLNIFVNQ